MYSFGLSLCHKPASRLIKALLVAMYIVFLLVSLVPLIADSVPDFFCPPSLPGWDESECDGLAIFEGLHAMFFLPLLTTIPLVIGIYKQVRNPLQTQSLTGLKLQTAIFALSAVFWIPRVPFPWDLYFHRNYSVIFVLRSWYIYVGFVTVNDAIFALGQGILLWLSLRQRRAEETERQPLLA
jgi:hypothetical protein